MIIGRSRSAPDVDGLGGLGAGMDASGFSKSAEGFREIVRAELCTESDMAAARSFVSNSSARVRDCTSALLEADSGTPPSLIGLEMALRGSTSTDMVRVIDAEDPLRPMPGREVPFASGTRESLDAEVGVRMGWKEDVVD